GARPHPGDEAVDYFYPAAFKIHGLGFWRTGYPTTNKPDIQQCIARRGRQRYTVPFHIGDTEMSRPELTRSQPAVLVLVPGTRIMDMGDRRGTGRCLTGASHHPEDLPACGAAGSVGLSVCEQVTLPRVLLFPL